MRRGIGVTGVMWPRCKMAYARQRKWRIGVASSVAAWWRGWAIRDISIYVASLNAAYGSAYLNVGVAASIMQQSAAKYHGGIPIAFMTAV